MRSGYVRLTEKEEIWAQMLIAVLTDNDIPCTALPVYGAGFALRTGTQEHLEVYVPAEHLPHASELLEELFSAEMICEEN